MLVFQPCSVSISSLFIASVHTDASLTHLPSEWPNVAYTWAASSFAGDGRFFGVSTSETPLFTCFHCQMGRKLTVKPTLFSAHLRQSHICVVHYAEATSTTPAQAMIPQGRREAVREERKGRKEAERSNAMPHHKEESSGNAKTSPTMISQFPFPTTRAIVVYWSRRV